MYAMSTIDWVLNKCDKLNNNFDIELLKSTKDTERDVMLPKHMIYNKLYNINSTNYCTT